MLKQLTAAEGVVIRQKTNLLQLQTAPQGGTLGHLRPLIIEDEI